MSDAIDLPEPRTWILSARHTFEAVKEMAEAEAAANGWDVAVTQVVVDRQAAAHVAFTQKAERPAARVTGVAGGAAAGAAVGAVLAGPIGAAAGAAAGVAAALGGGASASGAAPEEVASTDDLPLALNWTQLQEAFAEDGFYRGTIDGRAGEATWDALERRFAREAVGSKLADGWQGWSKARRKLAVEQAVIRDAGIEVGKIDGLLGPQTLFAREAFHHLKETGRPLLIPERDEVPPDPLPASGPAVNWPRQADCNKVYGPVGTNQTVLTLPYEMKLAWQTGTKIRRFSCHEKVHDAFLKVFQKTLAEYGFARITQLGLDLFGGCLNVRPMRGGSAMSMHSWGIAIDLDPSRNLLKMDKRTAVFARPEYEPFWRVVEGEGLVSLGRLRNFDWMHFQAARL